WAPRASSRSWPRTCAASTSSHTPRSATSSSARSRSRWRGRARRCAWARPAIHEVMNTKVLATAFVAAAVAVGAPTPAPPPTPTRRPGQPPPRTPTFGVGIEVINLNLSVTDGRNRYVTDLKEKDFAVYEDGIRQELSLFTHENLPISMSVLIDTS